MFAVEFPCAGDARPFDLFDQPLLAVRGSDGTLRIFHNIVPYDGCLTLLRPARGLKSINTHYHGLRYDLSGRLVGAPYWDGNPQAGPEALDGWPRDLVEVPSAERFGTLFINSQGGAPDIDEWLMPWRRLVGADFAVDRLVPARDSDGQPLIEQRSVNTNWKTYQENASINLLHEAFTHDIYRKSPEVPRVGAAGEPRFELTMEGSLLAFAHSRDQSGATHDGAHLPFKTAMAIIRRVSRRGETVIVDLLAAGTQAGNACWWRLANFVAHDLDQSQVIMSGLFLKLQM